MQVAVAGVEDVGDRQADARSTARRCAPAPPAAAGAGWCRRCSSSRARAGPAPGNAPLRPAQSRCRSASSLRDAPRWRRQPADALDFGELVGALQPRRRIRRSGSRRRPADSRRGRTARGRRGLLSIISSPAGMIPAAMMSATASPACRRRGQGHPHARYGQRQQPHGDLGDHRQQALGAGHQRHQVEARRVRAPRRQVSGSPSMVRPQIARMLCTVRPYLRQCTPPAFSATLPPIEQASCDEGSGA